MKRYPVFVMRFALAAMISGTFVVSLGWPVALIEWAHAIAGFLTVYLVIGLVLRSAVQRELRAPAFAGLVVGVALAVPGMPRAHAALSPVLFALLAWAAMRADGGERFGGHGSGRGVFVLPALVLAAIFFGVGYRHQTSGIALHLMAAMGAAGGLLILCVFVNDRYPDDARLRGAANLTIAAVLFQVVAGGATLVIRMLDVDGGLALGLARAAHITGAGPLLAAACLMAVQFRRRAVP